MSASFLPFELAFKNWIEDRGMGWTRSVNEISPAHAARTVTYRFSPRGEPRRLLVAFHGAGNDSLFGWIGLFKRQLEAGAQIFTFDLPGHGRDSGGRFAVDQIGAALEAAVAEAIDPCPDLPVHAVGVSLGGSLLLGALPAIQHRIASAALIVAPLRIELSAASALAEIRPANLAMLWREREHYGWTGLIPSFGPFKRDVYPLRLADPAPAGPFGYVAALNQALDALRLEDAARNVEIPALLAYGDRDRVVPTEQGARLARLIPGAHLLRVADGTHLSTPLSRLTLDTLDDWFDQS